MPTLSARLAALALALALPLCLAACDGGGDTDQPPTSEAADGLADPDTAFLDSYADRDGVVVRDSGLMYRVMESGDGATAEPGDYVRVHYRGRYVDGTEFDSSYGGEPAVLRSDRVIQGWVEALSLMQEGATWELAIPARLAYGESGRGKIPGGATLVFKVELLEVLGPTRQQSQGE